MEPAALELTRLPEPLRSSVSRAFVKRWRERAVLIVPSRGDASDIFFAVRELPQGLRTIWKTAMVDGAKHSTLRRIELPGLSTVRSLSGAAEASAFAGLADVLFVASETAAMLGMAEDECSSNEVVPGLELCRLDCFSESRILAQVSADRGSVISRGTAVSEVWNRYFRPCAKLHSALVLVDRYALAELFSRSPAGLIRLFEELGAVGQQPDFTLTVFTARPEDVSESEAIASALALFRTVKTPALPGVDIYLTEDSAFSRIAHYRYIRFGDQVCCMLDAGVSVLEGASTTRDHVISAQEFGSKFRDNENQLRANSRLYQLR